MNDKFLSLNKIKKIMQKSLFVGIFIAFLVGCSTPGGTNKQTGIATPNPEDSETIDPYTTNLGNYTIHNFMCDTTATEIDGRVNEWLPKAETYLKGLAADFGDVNEIQNEDVKNLINVLNDDFNYELHNPTGFDALVSNINDACAQVFNDIAPKINYDDQCEFIGYYKALDAQAYINGCAGMNNGNPILQENYERQVESARQFVDDAYTIEENNFGEITNIKFNSDITQKLDDILTRNSDNIGISTENLQKLINISLNVSSLDAMHDYAHIKGLETHKSCASENGNTVDDEMFKTLTGGMEI